jgi:hypothetical protein
VISQQFKFTKYIFTKTVQSIVLSVALKNAITVGINYLFLVFHLPTAGSGTVYYLTFTALMFLIVMVFLDGLPKITRLARMFAQGKLSRNSLRRAPVEDTHVIRLL